MREGIKFYFESLSTEYVRSALKVTFLATIWAVAVNTFFGIAASWLLTKFSFKGKPVFGNTDRYPVFHFTGHRRTCVSHDVRKTGLGIRHHRPHQCLFGTDIKIVFALPGVVLATIFVTFPFVSRELIPVLNAEGKEEEEAAALMGMKGFTIFRKITFPHIRWALLYGIILCTARALGEFGAVNAVSKTRGKTFTLPLEIDALYLSGSADSTTAAFAASSILVIIAIVVLILRNIMEYKAKNK